MISLGRGDGKGRYRPGLLAVFADSLKIEGGDGYTGRHKSPGHGGQAMGQTLHLGAPTVIEAFADRTPYAALLEDDGKVAYFYGLDTRLGEQAVLDSVLVYHVGSVLDHPTPDLDVHQPCDVEIVWSPDQQRVALLLNGYPRAAFDFEHKRAYCRSNFPSGSGWSPEGHAWDNRAVDFLNAESDGTSPAP